MPLLQSIEDKTYAANVKMLRAEIQETNELLKKLITILEQK